FPTIGLVGVWGWQKKRENKDAPHELIPHLAAVTWEGRTVYLVYDSDLTHKKAVAWAEWYFAQALMAKRATVKVARLPSGPEWPWPSGIHHHRSGDQGTRRPG